MKFGDGAARIFKVFIFVLDFFNVFRILYSYRLRQVTKSLWIVQIEFRAGIVADDPRENGILR